MTRAPSDRTLRRWLDTGRPKRVERLLDDPAVSARIEALTALADREVALLRHHVMPGPDFEERVISGVQERRDAYGVGAAVSDLLGLGIHVALALRPRPIEPPSDENEESAAE